MSFVSPTPQSLREDQPANFSRYSRDLELWDSQSNVIFYVEADTLVVGTPVPARYQIEAAANLDTAGGTLQISVDGALVGIASVAPGPGTVIAIVAVDVTVGKHTILLVPSGALMTDPQIVCRRGRKQ